MKTKRLEYLKEMSEQMDPGELLEAFEIFRLAVEKNKSGIRSRQKKVKAQIAEFERSFKLFKKK